MSLDDKFYPEDGSILTRFDNTMIKAAGKIGEAYQHLTAKSYKELVKTSYSVAVRGYEMSLLGAEPAAIVAIPTVRDCAQNQQFESPLEEEIRLEGTGRNRKSEKACRMVYGIMGVAAGCFYSTFLSNGLDKMSIFDIYLASGGLIFGISTAPFTFAEYLSKANVPRPPKKTVWERAADKLLEILSPQPLLAPAQADHMIATNSATQHYPFTNLSRNS